MGKILTLHTPADARRHYEAGVWQGDTLYGMVAAHAQARGDAFALRDPWRRLTWQQLLAEADRVAADLHAAGLRTGDRVSVWLASRVEATVVFLACSRNGYVCNTSLHQNYTVAEVAQLLQRIGSKAVFVQAGYGADHRDEGALAPLAQLPMLRRIYRLGTGGSRPEATGDFHAWPESAAGAQPEPLTDPDKVVYLAFTSGTTGTPKGVMHSDNTLLANGRAMVADWAHPADTILLSLSPMSHHIGTVALAQALAGGWELVTLPQDARLAPVAWIEESQATYVMGVPTHAMDILAEMRRVGKERLGRVRTFYMAGSPIPEATCNSFLALGVQPQNIYGMTENGSHQYTMPRDATPVITGTCGRACHGYEVKLWRQDDPDTEAAAGEIGEIGGRGGLLMLGYFGAQEATEGSFNAHGWFLSGDLGQFDTEGNLRIVGRKKDLIIRGGHNIHPAHIENLAVRHIGIAKAAAFAVADERLGEKVCLAVLPAAGCTPRAEEVLQHLNAAGLSKFDMPEYFIALEAFPLTASGKILKRELAEWARTGRIAPAPVRWQQPAREA